VDAASRFGGGFGALLWANRATQAARFDAICRLENLDGRTVLDVGCGRADLLEYCAERKITIADYTGIEAVPALAKVAREQPHENSRIIVADFVEQPASMFVGAEVVVISGALNTLDTDTFYRTIRRAFDAAAEALMLNFLDSPTLAAATFLTWHARQDVMQFARSLSGDVRILDDYLEGDSTIALRRETYQHDGPH
jgi:SAM-dependent methyltransferase